VLRYDHPPSTPALPRLTRRRRALITLATVSTAVLGPVALADAADQGPRETAAGTAHPTSADLPLLRALGDDQAVPFTSSTAAPATAATAAPPTTAAPTTTTTAPPPPPAPAPAPSSAYGDPNDPATWDRLAQCEAGGNWAANTGNGYYGGLQFSLGSWQAVGGTGYPHQHPRETQIEMGKRLQRAQGWGAWPSCSRTLGYR
jgi:hypothetical protein